VNSAVIKYVDELKEFDNPMGLSSRDMELIKLVQYGLPLCSDPYAEIGKRIDMDESEVITRLQKLQDSGVIKRMGVVVRHRKLGYRANAMVVWNIPDEQVTEAGKKISKFKFVTLCYRRPRHLPQWPYNLFSMIHGSDRDAVTKNIQALAKQCGLQDIKYEILFSKRCFKQRGAIYRPDESKG
jgi:DNA-binding Lrp family transcriptional regulator